MAGLLLGASCQGPRSATEAEPTVALLVRFAPGVSDARRDEILAEVGGRVAEELSLVRGLYKVLVARPADEACRLLEEREEVLYAHADHPVFPTSRASPGQPEPPTENST